MAVSPPAEAPSTVPKKRCIEMGRDVPKLDCITIMVETRAQ